MGQAEHDPGAKGRKACNAGRKRGVKRALKPKEVWAIRFWLDHKGRRRDRALFDLAVDSKLRGCDIVKLKIVDLVLGGRVRSLQASVSRRMSSSLPRNWSSASLSIGGWTGGRSAVTAAMMACAPRAGSPCG